MYKAGIIGATGYTGSELVRILHHHPEVEIALITSESHAGKMFSDIHPQFEGLVDYQLSSSAALSDVTLDVVFLALPHGVSMDFVKKLYHTGIRMIDLSGDFRLDGPETYKEWYHKDHTFKEGFERAVFGLTEFFRQEIQSASLIANPGCFPTGSLFALTPLLKAGLVEPGRIIVDAKTGATGAGVKAKTITHFPNVNDDFMAYGLKTHRHTIEIQQMASRLSGQMVMVQFTPHLLPVDRGILTAVYAFPVREITEKALRKLYHDMYDNEPFIRVRSQAPSLKNVRGTNLVDVFPVYDERTGHIMVFSAIDNLVKGAAGQAVQNMNVMLGIDETSGLETFPLQP